MSLYRLYGLSVLTTEALPGLQAIASDPARADVCLHLRCEPDWVREARRLPSQEVRSLEAEPETEDPAFVVTSYGAGRFFSLAYSDGTEFMVDGGGERVWGTWTPPWTKEDFATYLLGPVMGFVLRRRNIMPLHASAVSVAGKAIVLFGDAHAGKSTTAAALALRGMPVLCEDIASLHEVDGRYWVGPGYPRVCLWPDSVRNLMGREDALPRLTPNWEKRYLPLDGVLAAFQARPCPIGGIYLLAPRTAEEDAPRIEPMTPQDALLTLVQNSYMNWLLDREQRASEFEVLARLADQVPGRRIVPHHDAGRIAALCGAILADAGRLPSLAASQPNSH